MAECRLGRLTNENNAGVRLLPAVSLHFMHYNFVRLHQTLRVTPAMEAGVTDRLWELKCLCASFMIFSTVFTQHRALVKPRTPKQKARTFLRWRIKQKGDSHG